MELLMDKFKNDLAEFLKLYESQEPRSETFKIAGDMLNTHLIEKHPRLLKEVQCGVFILPGWIPLVDRLCENIQDIVDDTKGFQVIVDQVKEKFGGLRFYVSFQTADPTGKIYEKTRENIMDLIDDAETESLKICEYCGEPGKIGGTGWIKTTCEKHR